MRWLDRTLHIPGTDLTPPLYAVSCVWPDAGRRGGAGRQLSGSAQDFESLGWRGGVTTNPLAELLPYPPIPGTSSPGSMPPYMTVETTRECGDLATVGRLVRLQTFCAFSAHERSHCTQLCDGTVV
eukprot:350941-Chlamydomonas_euryale.AAC.15